MDFYKCNNFVIKFRYNSLYNIWISISSRCYWRNINLWCLAICKFCLRRFNGLWNYVCNFVYMAFKSWGISLGILPTALLALPLGIIFTIGVSLFFDRTVFKYYRNKKSSPVTFIVVSLGIMFVLNAVVRIIIGPNDIVFMDGSRFIISAVDFKETTGLLKKA